MKKKLHLLFVLLFFCACAVPGLGMVFFGESQAAANEVLSPKPSLTQPDGSVNLNVMSDAADYFADRFAFRQELITADSAWKAALFHTSSQEQVSLGREDWLFYAETEDDFTGADLLTQRQVWAIRRSLELAQGYVESKGASFLVTVAPNKLTLYPEHGPQGLEPGEVTALSQVTAALGESSVPYSDLVAAFSQQEEDLYHKWDSHWTYKGAALAHDALVAGLGKTDQEPFFSGTYHQGEPHLGDLYEMLYPTGTETEEDAAYDRPFAFSYVRPIRSAEDQFIQTENPDRSGSLLMFRDSFGNLLHTFLADAYGQAAFSRAMPYTMSLLDQTGADTVLIEIVERNLDWWATQAPIFPAPERVLTGTPPAGEAQVQYAVTEDGLLPGYVRLEGRLTGAVDENSPVYVKLGERLYEACPVGVAGKGTPFTLYVPQDEAQLTPEILYQSDGQLQTTGAVR